MEHKSSFRLSFQFTILHCLFLLSISGHVQAYTNYTVGDSLGWYDKLLVPAVNYQKWVSGKNFTLGDFLMFNTDSNHSIIQTYNLNTYKKCDYNNAQDNDTVQWSAADPSSTAPQPVSVAVPLVKVGLTYFFSSDYDGEQCKHGQHFKINVTYGKGLPESLKNPTDEAPAPADPEAGEDQPSPSTPVSSDFNNPKQDTTAQPDSASSSLTMFLNSFNLLLVFIALLCFV